MFTCIHVSLSVSILLSIRLWIIQFFARPPLAVANQLTNGAKAKLRYTASRAATGHRIYTYVLSAFDCL